MNRRITTLACALACLTPAWAAAEPVVLLRNGATAWRIELPASAGPAEKFAAAELARYVKQMSGAELAVAAAPGDGPAVVLGCREQLSPGDQAVLPAQAAGHDGYAVVVRSKQGDKPARIVIAGQNGRGVVYGTYDLLERFGCRWFYPQQDARDVEVVPRRQTLELAADSWSVASPMRYRICNGSSWFFEMDLDAARHQLDWAMKSRYNAMGWQSENKTTLASQYQRLKEAGLLAELDKREMFLHGPAHSFDHFLSSDDYFERHPEWFGMRDGKRVPQTFAGAQFCWSNAEARKQFIDNVETFIKGCPQIHILCIVSFDGGKACACPECTRVGASNALMVLMREVIERLSVSVPDVLVETVGGYEPMTEPPAGVEIHPRQRVIWAHWGRYHAWGYDDPRYDRRDNLRIWREASRGGITICQYYTDNFAEPWILPPFAIALEGDRRYFLEHGIDSVYMLMWPPGYWWNHTLNGYLAGRCFYDASLDPYAELHDYGRHYFGPAAGPLLAAWYEQWAREVDLAYKVKDDPRDEHRAILADQRKRWIDPAVAAAADDPLLAYRVGKVEKLHTLAERLGEVYRLRQEIQRLRTAGSFDEAARVLERARTSVEETLAYFLHLADLEQGLMDRNEVPTFITAKVKGWLDGEAEAIAQQKRE